MTTFAATHSQDVRSKAVDAVTYNENTQELVLDWDGALYKYSGVPLRTYEQVVAGTYKNGLTDASVGRAAQRIKKDFGPGTYLGEFGEVKFIKDETKATTFPASATKAATTAAATVAAGTTQASTPTYSLTPSRNVGTEKPSNATYTVDYTVGDEAYEYTPDGVSSVDEAVQALTDALAPLNIEGKAKGVYVEFV